MHRRIDAVEQRKLEARRNDRRARGIGAGSVVVGSQFIPRRRRSVAVVEHLSYYSISGDEVTQTALLGAGAGTFGSTLGFMSSGGSE